MKRRMKQILPLIMLALFIAMMAWTDSPARGEAEPEEAPKIPGVTKVEPGTKIDDIKSDPFTMTHAIVKGDVLSIKVSYSGGTKDHDFTLYWNQIVARSYPGKTTLQLKHDSHGDAAEALITRTLEFDLSAIPKPMVINIRTDHGDAIRVEYGEVEAFSR